MTHRNGADILAVGSMLEIRKMMKKALNVGSPDPVLVVLLRFTLRQRFFSSGALWTRVMELWNCVSHPTSSSLRRHDVDVFGASSQLSRSLGWSGLYRTRME